MTARGVLLGAGGRHRGWLRYAGYALLALVAFGFIAAPAQNAQPSDLVAAYAFNEGSGSSVADLSGNGNAGQIGSATWTTSGKYGGALSFNGSSARVTVPDAASLRLSGAMTLEAWVFPTSVTNAWRDVIYKGDDNYYLEATASSGPTPSVGGTFGGSGTNILSSTALAANVWAHLAATYDGSTLRLYVNGTQVASKSQAGLLATSTQPLQIGGDSIYGQFFAGRIDEVRVYRAALSQAEIQADMAAPLGGPPDTTVPSQVSGLQASAVSSSRIDLSWSAASDNVGVTGYEIERCQGSGCSSFAAVTTVSTLTWSDTGRLPGTSYSYRVRARDAAGNTGAYSAVATAVTPTAVDNPPSAPSGLSASASGSSQVNLSWTAATDDNGVSMYEVERCQGAGCSSFVQVATTASTSLADTGLAASTSYSYRVRARDTGNQVGPYSNVASATTGSASSTLVAAYAFEEGSGSLVADLSGNGNAGQIGSATWTTSGKYGGALSFNGSSARVTVPDAASLDLTTGMTLEAWVYPTSITNKWRDAIYKGNDAYYLSATSSTGSRPATGGTFGGVNSEVIGPTKLPVNTWTHLAATYDGATQRLFVNGVQVASKARIGSILTSTQPLQIGGDSIYGQFFAGRIDEVRVYNTALSAAAVQTDMNTPIGAAGGPSAPTNLAATANSSTEIDLTWGASTSGAGIAGYRVERCQGTGCGSFAEIASPSGTSYNDVALAPTTSYSYRVRAIDTAGKLGPYSTVAVAFTGVLVSPRQVSLTPGQAQQYSATVPGGGSTQVAWSVDGVGGGSTAVGTISAAGQYTAPATAGVHTITATATSGGLSGAATAYTTNYAGKFTFHNDNLRTGQNLQETVLTPTNVSSSTFGKLFDYALDGYTFASPLYVAGVNIPGQGLHNIVYVATEHDSVYAFDADGRSGTPLWRVSFINPGAGMTPIPPADTGENEDIPNEIGITGTPVIDPSTNTVYLVAATKEVGGGTTRYVNRLHALDLATGAEKLGGPVVIDASVPGTGVDAVGGRITFNNVTENQRPALLQVGGEIYVAFANHGFNPPYHGWVMAYNATTLHQDWVFCTTPNAQSGGVWMGGDGVAADGSGSLYFSTGNGTFDANQGRGDYGDTLLKLNPNGTVADYFTPYNFATLDSQDIDLASGGVILLPDQPGTHPHEVIAAGKGGTVYVVDRDNMGHVGSGSDNQIVQSLINVFPTGGSYNTGNYSAPTYFNSTVYFAPVKGPVMAFSLTNGRLSTSPTSQSTAIFDGKTSTFSARGGETAISANGNTNGILWALQSNGDGQPGTLHAYDPADLTHEYYTSDQAGTRDRLDPWLKFTTPLIANGHVYVISAGRLTAFGLRP